ncbi:6-phosphogluconolactonase [Nitrospinae bacterium AH_259_B05_G02_I21]|nr:6-phosphogluconolactonase [Nitrospinae bacterium AH_259_B05_G02_I21]
MRTRKVVIFDDAASLEEEAAQQVVRAVRNAVARRGECRLALSGGSTPRGLYTRLAEEPHRERVDWSKLHLFWGDERCVPPDHPESNYRMVHEALLARVPLLDGSVHRIPVELGPDRAAARYEEAIRAGSGEAVPRFDVVLLGMGADGHTASLFPDTPALSEERRLVVPTVAPTPPHDRVSITLRVINAARLVAFLVVGPDKARTLARVLADEGRTSDGSLPASLVRPRTGRLLWLLDKAAAAHLAMEDREIGQE